MPAAMRALPQWLLWRHEEVEGRKGLQKVPYYINGKKRFGDPGGPEDRARLATFDAAVKRLSTAKGFDGLAFAFLAGDGLVAIDLDSTFNADTGEVNQQHLSIVSACSSYTERSPSGTGLHIIAAGQTDSFKHDPVGVEVYCGGRYFACTGNRYGDTPADVLPLQPFALDYLRSVVQASKDRAKAERQAKAVPPPAPQQRHHTPGQQGNDFKMVNAAAYDRLDAWVPLALPGARQWKNGYRVRSKALNRELEEDLQLTPEGIMDFGEEQGMSPIDVVLKWVPGMAAPKDALEWLALRLGVTLTRRAPVRLAAANGAPTPEPDIGPDPPPSPPEDESATAVGEGGSSRRAPRRPRKGGGGPIGGAVERLIADYALIRGTDTVWDGEMRSVMAVKNLRLLFGAPTVNQWLAHPDRRLLLPEQIRFEPGVELPEGCVNLFDKLPTEPVPYTERDVQPMLDLLHHLCKVSARTPEGVQAVKDQMLKWCALMIQHPGAKSRFALVLHGPQGTGKNLFCDSLRKILGKYGKMVGQTELDDRFNGYMSGKLLLIGNEVVTRQELFHNKNKLKWVITEDEIPIRGMHQEVRWESNHANIIFLSNELMPVALEWDDRRHLVIYTPMAEDPDLYLRVLDFLNQDGLGKWMQYLLDVDLDGFNEHTKPLMTEAKEALIELGLKPAERFVHEWLEGVLDLPRRVCEAGQLFRVYQRWCQLNGERDFRGQAMFTRTVERYVKERVRNGPDGKRLPPALTYKPISLKDPAAGSRQTVRCWLPHGTGVPADSHQTEGEWAWSAVQEFETIASQYGRSGGNGGSA